MNIPTPQPIGDSRSVPEDTSIDSWDNDGDEALEEGSDSEAEDAFMYADEEFWEEDQAVDAWLARSSGGSYLLYPKLFLVKPRGGDVITPSRTSGRNVSLLGLPSEVRNRIYSLYFEIDEEVRHPDEGWAPFRDRDGNVMQRICLSSENVELKFLLSTALLQSSRQLRFEAVPVLFRNCVITVEWLPALPRFIDFLGEEGCAMIHYLDIWDSLNLQGNNNSMYQDIITSITHLSHLQHLRIVLACDTSREEGDRTYSWFDIDDWSNHDGRLMKHAVPKMRSGDIEKHWPEYKILQTLKTEKFTLAMETISHDRYLEFDKNHGAYPGISKAMRSPAIPTRPMPSQALEGFEAVETQSRGRTVTPRAEFGDEEFDSPTWQDTDTLTDKTLILYNFLRDFFRRNVFLMHSPDQQLVHNFNSFPTARKSTGSIIRDCPFCYLSMRHCGYHSVPDQPPFEPIREEGDVGEVDVKMLQTWFENMSYVDMRETCQNIAQWREYGYPDTAHEMFKVIAVINYLDWFEIPHSERLDRLDDVAETGWTGKKLDKDEVTPWDLLYREFRQCWKYNEGKFHLQG